MIEREISIKRQEKYLPEKGYALNAVNTHTHIIGHYNPSFMITSHTVDVVCFNFIREWWDVQFNVNSERLIFEKVFHPDFLKKVKTGDESWVYGHGWETKVQSS